MTFTLLANWSSGGAYMATGMMVPVVALEKRGVWIVNPKFGSVYVAWVTGLGAASTRLVTARHRITLPTALRTARLFTPPPPPPRAPSCGGRACGRSSPQQREAVAAPAPGGGGGSRGRGGRRGGSG